MQSRCTSFPISLSLNTKKKLHFLVCTQTCFCMIHFFSLCIRMSQLSHMICICMSASFSRFLFSDHSWSDKNSSQYCADPEVPLKVCWCYCSFCHCCTLQRNVVCCAVPKFHLSDSMWHVSDMISNVLLMSLVLSLSVFSLSRCCCCFRCWCCGCFW